ncbi:unnamed protein product, partial [Urochloa humidicola]
RNLRGNFEEGDKFEWFRLHMEPSVLDIRMYIATGLGHLYSECLHSYIHRLQFLPAI